MKVIDFTGPAYVVGNNIDTDQILPGKYIKINPSSHEGYKKLGLVAMSGLPDSYPPFVTDKTGQILYKIIIAGQNFGCGSSREQAPIALGASGIKVVIAESFARIFYRNCIASGELIPLEIKECLWQIVKTGFNVRIEFDKNKIILPKISREIEFSSLGPMVEIVEAGGLFPYARKIGRI